MDPEVEAAYKEFCIKKLQKHVFENDIVLLREFAYYLCSDFCSQKNMLRVQEAIELDDLISLINRLYSISSK